MLEGVPLLVLANKQDVPVLSDLSHLTKAMFNIMHIQLKTNFSLFLTFSLMFGALIETKTIIEIMIGVVLCFCKFDFVLCRLSSQNCLSVPDIKTAFSDSAPKIGKRDCLVQPCTALTG